MALEDQQAEPSMEEILASIRRIISEEEQAPEPLLDLTSAQTQSVRAARPVDEDIILEAVEAPAPAFPSPLEGTILSSPSANAAAGALARLAGQLRIADTPDQTLEGVVREMLAPMLKEWLERNLPGIVESRVEAELERIARMVR